MGRKKAAVGATETAPETPETAPVATSEAASDGKQKGGNKSELAGLIVKEFPEASGAELLAKFAERHPDIDWKSSDVTNGKSWLDRNGDGVPKQRRKRRASSGAAEPTLFDKKEPTLSELRAVQGYLKENALSVGDVRERIREVEEVAKLAGGLPQLSECLDTLEAFLP